MTDPNDTPPSQAPAKKRAGGLNSMLIADLRQMAGGMGVDGAATMKKAQLVEAIRSRQSSAAPPAAAAPATTTTTTTRTRGSRRAAGPATAEPEPAGETSSETTPRERGPKGAERPQEQAPKEQAPKEQAPKEQAPKKRASNEQSPQDRPAKGQSGDGPNRGRAKQADTGGQPDQHKDRDQSNGGNSQGGQSNQSNQSNQGGQGNQGGQSNQGGNNQGGNNQADAEDGEGRGRNRRRRGRDRERPARSGSGGGGGGGSRNEPDTTILEDDVLVPAAGILDVLDSYAFVRTSGYLPGADDVYVSLSMVRKYNLRRGDAIVGDVRQPREGERKEKFNPLVRIETINGADAEGARSRPEFESLTAVHPTDRLRLESGRDDTVGRVVDLASPLGKGQRALVVSPHKAGRTTLLQSVAAAVSANNPECHLMVLLLDERPEDVTDYVRSVRGEVVSSTFDRPASDHTLVAELAIERAKRLVELGHDVVMLVDGITRLARAYHLAAPASGRAPAGAVDAATIHPAKRFFGAARNIEDGGSLTIVATAVAESGSLTDEVVLEEFASTANAELRLRGDLAGRRLFPAIDVAASGTRREDLLMGAEELAILWKLRRALADAGPAVALELLLKRVTSSATNIELLTQVDKQVPSASEVR